MALFARIGTGLVAGLFLLTLSACPKDPYDPDTWIDQLDDPEKVETAVNKLADLKDPKAIKPLGKVWRKHSRSSRVLRIIIGLADQPPPKGPHWKDAVPILIEALDFQMGDSRSIEDAMAAADALGRAKDPSAVQALIGVVNKTHAGKPLPITDAAQNARIAALRALGNFGNDPRAVDTLIKVLQTDPLDDDNRDNPDANRGAMFVRGAAANALGATKNPKVIEPLVLALYQVDVIFPQVRGALTRMGQAAVPELMKVFQGKHAEVNKFAKENNFNTDCSQGAGPGTKCVAPGAVAYKSAIVLGDMRAKEAVPLLIDALKRESQTSYFSPKGVPGPPDHNGVLDALRKIGDAKATDVVGNYMKAEGTDDVFVRPLAIDVYSMLARDAKEMDYLAKQIKDDGQEVEEIRKSAGMAYARLVTKPGQLEPLDFMIERYRKKAEENVAKAAKAKKEEDKEDAIATAAGYRDLSTLFWQHKVRALVGIECDAKGSATEKSKCYLDYLAMPPAAIVTKLKIPVPIKVSDEDPEEMPKALKAAFQMAAQERALLEIGKLGPEAKSALPDLLRLADTTERLLREGVLLAIVQVAPKPCPECTQRLTEVIEMQKDQDRLSLLSADTTVVRNYFAAMDGGQAPAKPAEPAK